MECWEKLAENCAKFLKKGDHVTLIGDLRQDRWRDADGRPHSAVKIVARFVRFDSPRPKKNEEHPPEDSFQDSAKKKSANGGMAAADQRETVAAA